MVTKEEEAAVYKQTLKSAESRDENKSTEFCLAEIPI